MDENVKRMGYGVLGRLLDYATVRLTATPKSAAEQGIERIDKTLESLPAEAEELTETPTIATETPNKIPVSANPTTDASTETTEPSEEGYAGTSQVSATGKACVPCGSSHFQTVAGGLGEAMRFARSGGIAHPEVIDRINTAETELNTFERWDGAPEKVALLEGEEKRLMDDMMNASREMRHRLSDIKGLSDLEAIAAKAGTISKDFRARLFQIQIGVITPAQRKDMHERAEAIRAKFGKEPEPEMSLDEAKKMAAEQAEKEVEERWHSQEKK